MNQPFSVFNALFSKATFAHNQGVKLLVAVTLPLILNACSMPAPQQQPRIQNVPKAMVQAHQTQLSKLTRWQLSARMALIQKQAEQRDSVYLNWRWQQQPAQQNLLFSHPLKGQLAELSIEPKYSTLQFDGERYQDRSSQQLLSRVLGVRLPVEQLSHWVMGQRTQQLQHPQYIAPGLLSKAQVTTQDGQRWQINWFYDLTSDTQTLMLPSQIHLESNQFRIKLQLNDWQTYPQGIKESDAQ